MQILTYIHTHTNTHTSLTFTVVCPYTFISAYVNSFKGIQIIPLNYFIHILQLFDYVFTNNKYCYRVRYTYVIDDPKRYQYYI